MTLALDFRITVTVVRRILVTSKKDTDAGALNLLNLLTFAS